MEVIDNPEFIATPEGGFAYRSFGSVIRCRFMFRQFQNAQFWIMEPAQHAVFSETDLFRIADFIQQLNQETP